MIVLFSTENEVASSMDQTVNAVFGVASFYPNFRFTPPGRHSIEICWGPTCHIAGAMEIFEEAFDVEIPDEKAETILTVGDAIAHLEAK